MFCVAVSRLCDSPWRQQLHLHMVNTALAAVILIGGAQAAAAQTTSSGSALMQEGLEVYRENCAICHGPNGDGQGSLAPQFTPRPRDFTHGNFKFRSTGPGQPPAVTDLLRTITQGIEGSYGRSMPAFENLSFDQKIALLDVIRGFAGFTDFGIPLNVPPRPETATAQAGRALFVEYGCVECHGDSGDGMGILADGLTDESGLPIRPSNLQVGLFKGGNRPEDIWMRLQTGLDGTPMPSFGRNLSVQESWSLVEYVLEIGKN